MPRRTNQFQQLIFLVKRNVSPDAMVTESKMLVDRHTGATREVDVVIELVIAGSHPLVVSIECTDEGRPADVTWVDSMSRKHANLPTNLLLLASGSGFTSGAKTQAAADAIQLLTPEGLEEQVEVLGEQIAGFDLWRLRLFAESAVLKMADHPLSPAEVVEMGPEYSTFLSSGYRLGPLGEIVSIALGQSMDEGLIAEASPENRTFQVDIEPVAFHLNGASETQSLFVEKLSPEQHLKRVEAITVRGRVEYSISSVPATRGRLPGVDFIYGVHAAHRESVMVVRTVEDDGTERLSMRNADGTVETLRPLE